MAKDQHSKDKNKVSEQRKKLAFIVVLSLFALVVFCAGVFAAYSFYYSDKVLPRVRIGSYKLAGKNRAELNSFLNDKFNEIKNQPITISYSDKNWTKSIEELSIEPDLAKTTNQALLVGHQPGFLATLKDQLYCLFFNYHLKLQINADYEKLHNFIAQISSEIDQPEKNSSLSYNDGNVEVLAEQSGMRVNQLAVYKLIMDDIADLKTANLTLVLETKTPDVTKTQAEETKKTVEKYLSEQLTLTYQDKKFIASKDTLWSWLKFENSGKNLNVSFDQDKMKEWINSKVARKIDEPVKEARLKMDGDKVTVFQQASDGIIVDQEKLIDNIIFALNNGQHQAEITTKVSTAKDIDVSNFASMYLKDLVGTATTSFVNSPNNRVHNITTGANMFNGVIIRPGEEFSVTEVLGKVDASTGNLPELVIKEDGTKPEYGGGLCQVSTTLFRAAMNAGLKVTERTNHRYRVGYYEPPVGMDATIYMPKPDLKFVNTYNDYLLIQAKVQDYSITFDFYGRSDGRKIKVTDPIVYDVESPGAPQYIETDTMCKGEMKKIESSHDGAKASFDYYVYNANGSETNHQTFSSTYVPWQGKYLVGVLEGKSSKEVASDLYCSKRTVDFHLARIYEKLQVSNRIQAMRRATMLGILPHNSAIGNAALQPII